jgi:hypothetical protein
VNQVTFAMQRLADNLWLRRYPLKLFGADLRRNVSLIRLANGDLVVHSTAPFTPADVAEITEVGRVRWVLDAMLDHDTFSRAGRESFPDAAFLGPDGFAEKVGHPCRPILPPPKEWGEELQVLRIEGLPAFSEHVFFHQPSRTLIVADLIVNFENVSSLWMKGMLLAGIGSEHCPGASRRLKMAIKDRSAFRASIGRLMAWDFERVVVGHGEPLKDDARERVEAMFAREDWLAQPAAG